MTISDAGNHNQLYRQTSKNKIKSSAHIPFMFIHQHTALSKSPYKRGIKQSDFNLNELKKVINHVKMYVHTLQ